MLQVNTHFAAFFEIYKIDILLHRSTLNFLLKIVKTFAKLNIELNQNSIQIFIKTAISQLNFDEILSEFRECAQQ